MGVDCVWIARNLRGLTIDDVRAQIATWPGGWPGGSGEMVARREKWALTHPVTAYHWFEFYTPGTPMTGMPPATGVYVLVHDGCRFRGDDVAALRDARHAAIASLLGDADLYLCADSSMEDMDGIVSLWPSEVSRG